MSRILMVASEATPFAKSGGLADVVGALPVELQKLGHEVAVVMPRYARIAWDETASAFDNMGLYAGRSFYRVDIRRRAHNGVTYYLVDAPAFYDRPGLYDEGGREYGDNHRRFAVLSLAALGVAQTVFPCDILHCHDWQSALVPVYKADQQHANPVFDHVRTVLTIHNLGYQGRYGKGCFWDLGLNSGWFSPDKLEFHGDLDILKGGLVMADWLTTVSPTYAREIQTPEYGFGLDATLRHKSGMLTGILNGVDYTEWSPAADPLIPAAYSPADLAGKRVCKRELLREFGLPADDPERPLIGIVSRFVSQKGFDLIAGLASLFEENDVQLVVLGSGEWRYEQLFNDWQRWLPRKVGVWIGYNNPLAHKIEAGADMFLMPSAYEPCGLNQIYSLRYGTVPVVRATGGLDDTIQEDTGFKFSWYSTGALYDSLRAALGAYRNRDAWRERMIRGMKKDFSWAVSAAAYSSLYGKLLGGA